MTHEAFMEMRAHLNDHGTLVINSFGESIRRLFFFLTG